MVVSLMSRPYELSGGIQSTTLSREKDGGMEGRDSCSIADFNWGQQR